MPENKPVEPSVTTSQQTSAELDPGPPLTEPQIMVPEPQPPACTQFQSNPEPFKAKSPPKQSSEIEEGKVKNTLKEIISEIDTYVEKDNALNQTKTETTESVTSVEKENGYDSISQFSSTDYSSEALKV